MATTKTLSKERLAQLVATMRNKGTISEEQARRHQEVIGAANMSGVTVEEQISSDQVGSVTEVLVLTNSITHMHVPSAGSSNLDDYTVYDKYGKAITYNEKQKQFVELAGNGRSAVLIGAAGTGKTTCQQGTVGSLIRKGKAGLLEPDGHKFLMPNTPGIVVVSFTRRAVSNIRRAVSEDMKNNCLTIHALLEYEPVYYDEIDTVTGDTKKTMRFEPTRNMFRPLPKTIRTCIIEEASMVSVELFNELKEALPSDCQFIFLGDIQQLPPVFGSAILGFKMLELPVVELTEVYRQALESPIIRLAHRILSGNPIPLVEYTDWKVEKQLTIHPWKKKLAADTALLTLAKFMTQAIDHGHYNPEDDMILMPFNKSCGTIELNKHIAQHLARQRGETVWEVVAGFNKLYLAVGDKVLVDKEDAVIIGIEKNPSYTGAMPQAESKYLDYWGYNSEGGKEATHHLEDDGAGDIDFLLSQVAAKGGDGEDRVRQASHKIKVMLTERNYETTLETAGDLNALIHAFCLTVHKSQGSEFRKVFLLLHQSHATMLSRELLYTAVTRAREELYVICEPESFTNGINSQRIKGNTLAEKAEFFKGKVEAQKAEGRLV
jgi:exodeoxyribonuclease V alpha subunit